MFVRAFVNCEQSLAEFANNFAKSNGNQQTILVNCEIFKCSMHMFGAYSVYCLYKTQLPFTISMFLDHKTHHGIYVFNLNEAIRFGTISWIRLTIFFQKIEKSLLKYIHMLNYNVIFVYSYLIAMRQSF